LSFFRLKNHIFCCIYSDWPHIYTYHNRTYLLILQLYVSQLKQMKNEKMYCNCAQVQDEPTDFFRFLPLLSAIDGEGVRLGRSESGCGRGVLPFCEILVAGEVGDREGCTAGRGVRLFLLIRDPLVPGGPLMTCVLKSSIKEFISSG